MGRSRRTAGDHCRTVLALTDPVPRLDPDAEVAAWAASGAMSLTGRRRRRAARAAERASSRASPPSARELARRRASGGRPPRRRPARAAGRSGPPSRACTAAGRPAWVVRPASSGRGRCVGRGLPRSARRRRARARLAGGRRARRPVVRSIDDRGARASSRRGGRARARLARSAGVACSARRPATRPPVVSQPLGSGRAGSPRWQGSRSSSWRRCGPARSAGRCCRRPEPSVIKVESIGRPDGARRGPAAFFDLLNAGKRSVAVDLQSADGMAQLAAVIAIGRRRDRGLASACARAARHRCASRSSTAAARACGCRSPGTVATDRARLGRVRRRRGGRGRARGARRRRARCSAPTRSPIRWRGWWPPARCWRRWRRGSGGSSTCRSSAVAAAFAGPTLPVPDGVVAADPAARAPAGRGPALDAPGG